MSVKLLSSSGGSAEISAPVTANDYALALPAKSGTVDTTNRTGNVLQVVNAQTAAFFSTTSTIDLDDTLPQNTEGAELLTCSITPTSASSKLRVDVQLNVVGSTINIAIAALFKDSEASAVGAVWSLISNTNNPCAPITMQYYGTAGTESTVTFKVRGGMATGTGGTFQLNGGSGTRYLGGSLVSSITITEIAA